MLFSSIPFLYFFLPATVILYLIAPKKVKNAVLLLASLVFYAWGEKLLVILFAAAILIGWLLGLAIEKKLHTPWAKFFMILSVVIDLGMLVYFKYTDFFISSFNGVFGALGASLPLLKIALPIGISFYTFQILSYTIDVYRGSVPAQRNLINFAAYVSLFPQLIAGPIVRYSDVAEQLTSRTHSVAKTASGVRRFLIGLGKKVLIANVIGEVATTFRGSDDVSVLFYWMYAVAYMLQIYFDFSGYSDMAIGLGRMFGFEFMENFNYPYVSTSITEFWRRWHISLGSWFRDYVYIPLGGNRHGIARQLLNICIVWALTGLWHGAAWNFVLWGVLYAILLTVEKLGFKKKVLDRAKAFGHVYVIFTVMFGFLLFNASSLGELASDVSGLFAFGRLPLVTAETLYCLRSYALVFVIAILAATPLPKMLYDKLCKVQKLGGAVSFAGQIYLIGILVIVTAYLIDGSFNPFLYFRF